MLVTNSTTPLISSLIAFPGVKYEDLAYASHYGFAVVGTNNGHNGTGGIAFYQNPDVMTDYSWRASVYPSSQASKLTFERLHTGVVAGKTLTDAYYEKSHKSSYYIGCSGGGRQGLKAAEMFPEGQYTQTFSPVP